MKIWILDKKENFERYENLRFIETAKQKGIDLELVYPEEFDIIVSQKGVRTLLRNGTNAELPDCLIPRTGSGSGYFALAVIRHLEDLDVLILNNDKSIELAQDKLESFQEFAHAHMPIPKTMLARLPIDIKSIKKRFRYPIIIKKVVGSYGKGIFLCENDNQLNDLVDMISSAKDSNFNIVLQEFVGLSAGKDLRVFVVGGRAIGAMTRTAQKGKYKANFTTGGRVKKFKLNQSVEWLSVEAAKIIGLEIAGVDLLFGDKSNNEYKICEVNSAPGFEGLEKATGMNVPEEIFGYIELLLGNGKNSVKKKTK